jgi:hypothetical protein
MVSVRILGHAREVSVGVIQDGHIALEFQIRETEDEELTLAHIYLHPRRAGHLLELLQDLQRQGHVPLISGSVVQEKYQ